MAVKRNIKSAMRCPVPGGFLVAIEGIDGAGKRLLPICWQSFAPKIDCPTSFLRNRQRDNSANRFETQQLEVASRLRKKLNCFARTARSTLGKSFGQLWKRKKIVILDRYYFSTAAYQGAHGADAEFILTTNEVFAPQPDLLVVLDVSPQMGITRIRHRGDTPNKFETNESLEKARQIFQHIKRPYKFEIDAENGIEYVSFFVGKAFQACAMNKISKHHFSLDGLNRTREFFGEDRLPIHAVA